MSFKSLIAAALSLTFVFSVDASKNLEDSALLLNLLADIGDLYPKPGKMYAVENPLAENTW